MNAMFDHSASTLSGPVTMDAVAPLSVDGVIKQYDHRSVLRGVTLAVEPGAVLGLIGRNGAGKSTLIRAMLGLIEPDAGSATVWEQRPRQDTSCMLAIRFMKRSSFLFVRSFLLYQLLDITI